MKFVFVLALLACVSSVYAHGNAFDDFWRKYGGKKIMKDCLTPAGLKTWKLQLQKALADCNKEVEGRSLSLDTEDGTDWDAVLSELSPAHARSRRSPKYSAEKIKRIREKLSKQVETFRCVMKAIKVTNADNTINKETIMEQYRVLDLSATLMKDIERAVNHCYDYVQCVPLEGRNDLPLPIDVLRNKKFLECEMTFRYKACLKNDLVPYVKKGYFDFKGLEGRMNKLDDDETRALAILMAEEFVGPKDYGLYE